MQEAAGLPRVRLPRPAPEEEEEKRNIVGHSAGRHPERRNPIRRPDEWRCGGRIRTSLNLTGLLRVFRIRGSSYSSPYKFSTPHLLQPRTNRDSLWTGNCRRTALADWGRP